MPRIPRYRPLKNVGTKEYPENLFRTNKATKDGFVIYGLGYADNWEVRRRCDILLVKNTYFEIHPDEKEKANKVKNLKNSGYLYFTRFQCQAEGTTNLQDYPTEIAYDARSIDRYFYEVETGIEVSNEKYESMLLYKGRLFVQ